jgi:hypothetical protein
LAAVLLSILIIASSVSKLVHSRAQSAETTIAARGELPSGRSIRTGGTREVSAPQRTKRLIVQTRSRALHPRLLDSVRTPEPANSERGDGSSLPPPISSEIQYSAKRHGDQPVLSSWLFSNGSDVEHPRFFRRNDTNPDRPRLNVPLLVALTEYRPLVDAVDREGAHPRDHKATFAISLNPPLHVVRYKAELILPSASTGMPSELQPKIDWYQVWLKTGARSLRDSDNSSQYYPGGLGPEWPFSKESKGDQQ